MNELNVVAVIPARMGSSRFPGKPLLNVRGLPMVEHVRRRTLLCRGFSEVVVATCDDEIRRVVEGYGGSVVMTAETHIMASDRVAEAVGKLSCTHVINVQGDEILIMPEDLQAMVEAIAVAPEHNFWNAVANVNAEEELADWSIVKCAISTSGRIMYCARDFTHMGLTNNFAPVRKILGVLGYSRKGITQFNRLGRTPIEQAASIDQSRVLEHDLMLVAVPFSGGYPGINEPREVAIVEHYLNEDARQKEILEHILTS